jgi:hypothetical protein
MNGTHTTRLLKLADVATELGVSESTVQDWVYGTKEAEPVLDSFAKVKGRRVSVEDLTRFVLANTVRPHRPKWLTPEVESKFRQLLREEVRGVLVELQEKAA